MAYEPSKEAVKAAAIEWSGAPFPAPRSITKARAALIAAHESENTKAREVREVTVDDIAILISVLGLMLDNNRYTKPCVKAALEAVEAHRAKKG